jgi:hypothetical protein
MFQGIKEGEKLPDSYLNTTNPLAEKQIVLAGYRLAYIIESLFGTSSTAEAEPIETPALIENIQSELFLQ